VVDVGKAVVQDVARDPRLSELSTQWTMLFRAHHGSPEEVNDALRLMMLRYEGAVHRYLLKAVGDAEAVRELDQEFALRFLKGSFLKFDPSLGRFRDYVKRAVRNLMVDHYRGKGKTRHLDTGLEMSIVGGDGAAELDEQFTTAWRDELLDRAWNALEAHETRTGNRFHSILKHRARHPRLNSAQMAEQLAPVLGRSVTAGALRQLLQRSREQWVKYLIDEVKVSLKTPTRDEVEQELADLKLLELCKPVLNRLSFDIEPP
jgi:RNA polymerase sigma factor (sigma-70 family)